MYARIPPDQRHQAAMRLPGVRPVGRADWITVDAAYADQIAEKARLIRDQQDAVYQVMPEAVDAATELLDEVLVLLRARPDFAVSPDHVLCPDGRRVTLGGTPPLLILAQLLQEDLCIHLASGGGHRLAGALLCFPASWTLAEKIGKPLIAIHAPVPAYDASLGTRVQRLFDGVQVGLPLWRANCFVYADPALFHPRREADPRDEPGDEGAYERSERQTLFRLPRTQAVVFAIHTTVQRR